MANSKNDYEKHVQAWEQHLAALDGGNDGRWTEMTAKEVCKLLARQSLGLNGGGMHTMNLAAEKVGFDFENVVFVEPGVAQVVTLIEFVDDGRVH